MLRVVLDSPHSARIFCSGRMIARLTGLDAPVGCVIAYLTVYDPNSRCTVGVGRWMYPDGSCVACDEWHGWLLDLALEAGWQCPALDAAVEAQSRSET